MFSLRNSLKSVLGIKKAHQRMDQIQEQLNRHLAEQPALLSEVSGNAAAIPAFQFHQPLDFALNTYPVRFSAPVRVAGVELPVPAPEDRMGYAPEDTNKYLSWGAADHDLIMGHIQRHAASLDRCAILDFGCSTGRVLRHFDKERQARGWKLHGVDIQARCIEWLRSFFPDHFLVATCSTMPHLPFPDNSFDFIYGISVFTHIKYLWDTWLLELKRILKPNGLLMQSIHAEPAWEFYYQHRNEKWVRDGHSEEMLTRPKMDVDYLYYGDASVSQIFWKEAVARRFWSRYFTVLEVTPPPPVNSFQNWMICRKDA